MVGQKQQKLLIIILHKFSLLIALAFKLHDLIVACKLLGARRNAASRTYICARKNNLRFKSEVERSEFCSIFPILIFNELSFYT